MVQVINNSCEETNTVTGKPTRRKSSDKGTQSSPKSVNFNNLREASELFQKAIKENKQKEKETIKRCIEYMDSLLSDMNNILPALIELSKIRPPHDTSNYHPSAPPMDPPQIEYWVEELTDKLRNNILLEIDKNADLILKQKEICDLCYVDLLTITTRDSLQISRELIVYVAIMRWAEQECGRQNKSMETDLKYILEGLIYAPRYGLMSKDDFLYRSIQGFKGPDRSGLLSETEIEKILNYITKKDRSQPLPNKGSQARIIGNQRPHKLSSRSPNSSRESSPDSKIKPREKALINFLTCWSAVFD